MQNLSFSKSPIKKIINKLFPDYYKKSNDPTLVKYNDQFDPKEMVFGFQVLVCKKVN